MQRRHSEARKPGSSLDIFRPILKLEATTSACSRFHGFLLNHVCRAGAKRSWFSFRKFARMRAGPLERDNVQGEFVLQPAPRRRGSPINLPCERVEIIDLAIKRLEVTPGPDQDSCVDLHPLSRRRFL